ncbi:FixH family protein [Aquimarina agarivorans]|uniref:FixH family protein n=1 Tax=Aquimarina agarivorans TaxID=980584 RepID=UPI000248EBC4|nr:FixH family protein [Aquimarina agarivorans]
MKFNWGTGIVIGIALFMSFILFFVIKMSTNKQYSHDLVTEEYYAKEMAYQTEIDAETNTNNLVESIKGKRVSEGWLINFPSSVNTKKIKGKVFLYRPSNKKLDFDLPIVFSGSNLLIPENNLIDGRWNITIDWTYEGKPYLYKKEIMY